MEENNPDEIIETSSHSRSVSTGTSKIEMQSMSRELSADAWKLYKYAEGKAEIIKIVKSLFDILIIIGGIIVGIAGITNLTNCTNCIWEMLPGIVGLIISGLKTITIVFSLEVRGASLKQTSTKLHSIARKARFLAIDSCEVSVMKNRLEKLYACVDECDILLYSDKGD